MCEGVMRGRETHEGAFGLLVRPLLLSIYLFADATFVHMHMFISTRVALEIEEPVAVTWWLKLY